jgi:HSP20 family molecular chaperone IbpA
MEWTPQMELMQKNGQFMVRADLPGLTKDDVKIELTENMLMIRGERKEEKEEKREGFYHSERSYGSFYRRIPLPEGAKIENATATFHNGVLEITMPAKKVETAIRKLESRCIGCGCAGRLSCFLGRSTTAGLGRACAVVSERVVRKGGVMVNKRVDLGVPLAVIELLARLGSVASITLLILIFMNEAFEPSEISRNEWIGLVFFPIGVVIGMVIAWWKEGVGSVVTVASLVGFYLVYGYVLRNHIGGLAFVAFASPAFLFLAHWLLSGKEERHAHG